MTIIFVKKLMLLLDKDIHDAEDDENQHNQGYRNPERRQDPNPGPIDFIEELEDDENNRQESGETDTTTGIRRRITCHN